MPQPTEEQRPKSSAAAQQMQIIQMNIKQDISDVGILSMGQILEKAAKSAVPLALGLGLVGMFLYGLKESREKQQLLRLLQQLGQRPRAGVAQGNEVYLGRGEQADRAPPVSEHPIYKIAISGGPCAGKSTSLGSIRCEMEKHGFRVLGVPEIPTLVVKAGGMILMSKFNLQERIKFQTLLIHFQMYAEDYFIKLAALSKSPAIVLCDRGSVDPAAYITQEEFQAIMDEEGWNLISLRDRRYDRVIFLCSAANGAEKFYTLENNVARSEGLEEARNLDRKSLAVWTGHPHLTICPNVEGETFEQKIFRAVKAVRDTVGLEKESNFIEKFVIRKPQFPPNLKYEEAEVEEIFLKHQDQRYEENKIKKQGQNQSFTYQRKLRGKKDEKGNFRLQIRHPLTSVQYAIFKEQNSDPSYKPVRRNRLSFTYNALSYTIDVYDAKSIHPNALKELGLAGEDFLHILRFQNEKENPKELFPPFLSILLDVRQDRRFSLKEIAKTNQ